MTTTSLPNLIDRIGSERVERRLKVETEHESQLFGQGLILFNLENWYSAPSVVRNALKLTGLYSRARRKRRSNSDQTKRARICEAAASVRKLHDPQMP